MYLPRRQPRYPWTWRAGNLCPPSICQTIADLAKRGNYQQNHVRLTIIYRKVINKIVDNFVLKKNAFTLFTELSTLSTGFWIYITLIRTVRFSPPGGCKVPKILFYIKIRGHFRDEKSSISGKLSDKF